MTLLPIVARELRVAARRPATYWSRLANAASALIIVSVMLAFKLNQPPRLIGFEIFQSIFFISVFSCLGTGLRLTADCISSEKREGTIGFLFLTDLKGYDVIFGKLVVTSMSAFYGLLAVIPVLALPLLMGGVRLQDVGIAAVVLVNTMLFSLSAGMVVSTINVDARKSAGWGVMLVAGLTVGPPMVGGLLAVQYGLNIFNDLMVFFAPSPGFAAVKIFDRMGAIPMAAFWKSTAAVFGLSCTFLALASYLVTRTWQDKAVKQKAAELPREEEHQRKLAIALRTRMLDINPMLWLAGRGRWKRILTWLGLAGAGIFWFWTYERVGRDVFNPTVSFIFIFVLNAVIKVSVGAESGQRFGTDARSGALELILSTRIGVWELLHGQLLALRWLFLRPAIVVLAADILLLAGTCFTGNHIRERWSVWEMALAAIAISVVFVADVRALSWSGMWLGLAEKELKRASGQNVMRVLMLPWIGVVMVNAVFSILSFFLRKPYESSFLLNAICWVVFSLVVDWVAIWHAKANLISQFRTIAMQRYLPEKPHGIWAKLGRWYAELTKK